MDTTISEDIRDYGAEALEEQVWKAQTSKEADSKVPWPQRLMSVFEEYPEERQTERKAFYQTLLVGLLGEDPFQEIARLNGKVAQLEWELVRAKAPAITLPSFAQATVPVADTVSSTVVRVPVLVTSKPSPAATDAEVEAVQVEFYDLCLMNDSLKQQNKLLKQAITVAENREKRADQDALCASAQLHELQVRVRQLRQEQHQLEVCIDGMKAHVSEQGRNEEAVHCVMMRFFADMVGLERMTLREKVYIISRRLASYERVVDASTIKLRDLDGERKRLLTACGNLLHLSFQSFAICDDLLWQEGNLEMHPQRRRG